MPATFAEFMSDVGNIIKRITVFDVLDILIVAVLLYFLYKFIKDRRAGKLAIGILILIVLRILSGLLDMYLLQFILQNIFQVGILVLIILFQPELRSVLEKMGGTPMKGIRSFGDTKYTEKEVVINEVVSAVADLSSSRTGALIVFERETRLGDMILTGTVVDATPSSALIKNIFFNKAPMHDGAIVIRDNRVYAAGCFLPLSNNPDIIKDLGTRHRAGIGMSENSDALVIIVSEETGIVSVAFEGNLTRNLNSEKLTAFLRSVLIRNEQDRKAKGLLQKIKDFFRGGNKEESAGEDGEAENG